MNELTAIVRALRWIARRTVPAAHDNRIGRDIDALRECRYIAREPLTNPEASRDADDYLRRKEGEQP